MLPPVGVNSCGQVLIALDSWLRHGAHSLLTNSINGQRPLTREPTSEMDGSIWTLVCAKTQSSVSDKMTECSFRKWLKQPLAGVFFSVSLLLSWRSFNFLMTQVAFFCPILLYSFKPGTSWWISETSWQVKQRKTDNIVSLPGSLFCGPVRREITVFWANLILKILTTVLQVTVSSETFNVCLQGMAKHDFNFSINWIFF